MTINEQNDVPGRSGDSGISARSGTNAWIIDHANRNRGGACFLFDNRSRPIGRTSIRDQNLEHLRWIILLQQLIQQSAQAARFITHRQNDRNLRQRHVPVPRSPPKTNPRSSCCTAFPAAPAAELEKIPVPPDTSPPTQAGCAASRNEPFSSSLPPTPKENPAQHANRFRQRRSHREFRRYSSRSPESPATSPPGRSWACRPSATAAPGNSSPSSMPRSGVEIRQNIRAIRSPAALPATATRCLHGLRPAAITPLAAPAACSAALRTHPAERDVPSRG